MSAIANGFAADANLVTSNRAVIAVVPPMLT